MGRNGFEERQLALRLCTGRDLSEPVGERHALGKREGSKRGEFQL